MEKKNITATPNSPNTPEVEEEEDEPAALVFQRVLKHNILQVLPSVVDPSLRLQAIWILAQFVVSSDLQKVLLGLVLQRLRRTDTHEVVLNEKYGMFQHVGMSVMVHYRRLLLWQEVSQKTNSMLLVMISCCLICCCVAYSIL